MLIVLIGPHGVGKTTLGHRLSDHLGLPFHTELGRQMAEDPAWRPVGRVAADESAAFDQELFAREFARDAAWGDRSRVVETWHPGNLAYAAARSPGVAAAWLAAIRSSCAGQLAVAVLLRASRVVLERRRSEPGDGDFFIEVGAAACGWCRSLGLVPLSPIDTGAFDAEQLAEIVASRVCAAASLRPSLRPPPPIWS